MSNFGEPNTAIAASDVHLTEAVRILEEMHRSAVAAGKPVRAGNLKGAIDAITAARTIFKIFGHGLQDRELSVVMAELHDGVAYINGRKFVVDNVRSEVRRHTIDEGPPPACRWQRASVTNLGLRVFLEVIADQ